jgi:lysine-specific demethylase/histidyl-hydroxylase NO66
VFREKKPLVINRHNASFYDNAFGAGKLFTLEQVHQAVREGKIRHGDHLSIVKYNKATGEKEEYAREPGTVASHDEVQQRWRLGCTLQVRQPQQFSDALDTMTSALEDYFECLVGTNSYITPSKTQGLAPHYDDVEVFVLQVEGAKEWIVHRGAHALPRLCSGDLNPNELGTPLIQCRLNQGDLLYLPRGTIHQVSGLCGLRV